MRQSESLAGTRAPVVFVLFRRPEETARVFDAIRRARPSKLFLVADGPRTERLDDVALCEKARAVVRQIDWDCQVERDFSDENLGCGRRLPTGLDWVFQQVEEAIILEDDCVPHPSFFRYCDILLERFRHDERVMHINGSSFGEEAEEIHPYSYGFTHLPQVWGWATWRRAWQAFDYQMDNWPFFRDRGCMASIPFDRRTRQTQRRRWELVSVDNDSIWDYQWHFSVVSQHGLAVTPAVNLISNVGFGPGATHTRDITSRKASMPTKEMSFPLHHPPFMRPHPVTDRRYAQAMMGDHRLNRILRRIRATLPKWGG